MGAMRGGV
uniref:Uncharacterized protein n=1 Tax=Arundo donax TaxID=35708 RepID=A0A0A9FSN8_ARUDO